MGDGRCCCGKYNAAEGSKIIGVVSTVLAVLSLIGTIYGWVRLERQADFIRQLFGDEYYRVEGEVRQQRIIIGVSMGVAIASLIVSVLLIMAVKKSNRYLALPFMIFFILANILFGIAVGIYIFVLAVYDWSKFGNDEEETRVVVRGFIVPLVTCSVSFVLYTWWLVVVFDFYRELKEGRHFDSIPMQTA